MATGDLTRDAEMILHLPRDPHPVVDWWVGRGEGRAITVRLTGEEVRAVAVEEYRYPDGRVAYRIHPAGAEEPLMRVWWDDRAMRWGWLPLGQDVKLCTDRSRLPDKIRRRSWTEYEGWPPLWVHLRGAWREAVLYEREDWPDRTVVYKVGIIRPPGERVEGREDMRIIWDPRSVQPRRRDLREDGSQAWHRPTTRGAAGREVK